MIRNIALSIKCLSIWLYLHRKKNNLGTSTNGEKNQTKHKANQNRKQILKQNK
jgi:hypothetical protein